MSMHWLTVHADSDPGLMALSGLSSRHSKAFAAVIAEAEAAGDDGFDRTLTVARLCLPGGVLPRATMLWRNQPGPPESWKRGAVGADSDKLSKFKALCDPE